MISTYPQAIQMPVPHDNVFWSCNPKYAIVLHGTAGWQGATAQDIAVMFANAADKRSSHFIVGRDGAVVECVSLADGAGANGELHPGHDPLWDINVPNLNLVTVSIEHVKWTTDNSDPLTDAQKLASFKLVKWLTVQLGIPASHIKGHNTIDPDTRKDCPGNYPWAELYAYLGNQQNTSIDGDLPMLQLSDPMGQYFQQINPTRWHCKQTNADIAYGHLDFYRQHGGIFGLPLMNEVYLAQLPGTAIMIYERAIAIYDPKHSATGEAPPSAGAVYLLHLDGGIGQQILAKPLTSAINQQVATLQKQVSQLQSELSSKPDVAALQTQINSYQSAIQSAINQFESIVAQAKGKSS